MLHAVKEKKEEKRGGEKRRRGEKERREKKEEEEINPSRIQTRTLCMGGHCLYPPVLPHKASSRTY